MTSPLVGLIVTALEGSAASPSPVPLIMQWQKSVSGITVSTVPLTQCTFSTGGGFPIQLDLFSFSPEQHTLTVTATDAAGQPSSYEYTFFGIPELELACTYDDDSNTLLCQGNNDVVSSTCAFDGQAAVQCSLPVEIRLTGLRLGQHNVTVTATDLFGQTESVFSIFEFALGPINISVPSAASVIEGKELSPVMFSISGQTLSTFPFSLSPLTYSQFETQTGLSVNSLFDNVPPPAAISKQPWPSILV